LWHFGIGKDLNSSAEGAGLERERRRWRIQRPRQGKKQGVSEASHASARDDYVFDRAFQISPSAPEKSTVQTVLFSIQSEGLVWNCRRRAWNRRRRMASAAGCMQSEPHPSFASERSLRFLCFYDTMYARIFKKEDTK